jgi:hypothetical protein
LTPPLAGFFFAPVLTLLFALPRPARKTPEARYRENLRKQQKTLEEFAAAEIEWADDLLLWYRVRKQDIPDDEYRAVAFLKSLFKIF